MGVGSMAVDARVAIAWLFSIPFDFMRPIAKYVTVYFLAKRVLGIKAGWEVAYFRTKMNGRRVGGLAMRNVTGLLSVALAAVLLIGQPTVAQAEFSIIVPESNKAAEKEGGDGAEIDMARNLDDPIRSFGHDMRLEDAVNLVIPGDYMASFSDEALKDRRVSWRSENMPPREILVLLANQAHAEFLANEKRGNIHFSTMRPGYRMSLDGPVRDKTPRQFVLRAGHMLSHELARWATDAGFVFRYEYPDDYPVEVDALFAGYLPEVLDEVLGTYQRRGALAGAVYIPGSRNDVLAFEIAR
jgi:hypothetical protein